MRKSNRRILTKTNHVFDQATKIAGNAKIADKDEVLVNFKTRGRCLLAGFRIDLANIHIQPIENRTAVRSRTLS